MTNLPALARLLAILIVAAATPVSAQTATSGSKWQVEVYGGASVTKGGTDGTAGQFPVGEAIPVFAGRSRAVPSWYFGDGTKLFNEANAALGGSGRITPLDPALTRALAHREESGTFGARISRRLTSRIAAELSLDYAPASLRMTDDAARAIEASRASFSPALTSLLAPGFITDRVIDATADIDRGKGHEITLDAALKFRLPGTARLTPYVTAGGGAVFNRGTLPSATLTGSYSFRFGGSFAVSERDQVTIRVRNEKTSPFGMVGGGIEYNVAARHGIRGDVRVRISGNGVDTLVSTSPLVTTQSPAVVLQAGSNPGVVFSTNPATGRRSSLGGAVTDLRTFEGSGTRFVTSLSIGYFVRF